jgi:hypothetical protein
MAWYDSLAGQYASTLGRQVDSGGLDYWKGLEQSGMQPHELQAAFNAAAEQELAANPITDRQRINASFEAQGMQPWYNDTTTALGGWQGDPMAGGSWAGPKQDDFRNPYYQQGGGGYDFVQQSEQAILPVIEAARNDPAQQLPYFNPWEQQSAIPQIGTPNPSTGGGSVPPAGGGVMGALSALGSAGGGYNPNFTPVPMDQNGDTFGGPDPRTNPSVYSGAGLGQLPQAGGQGSYLSQNPYLSGMADDIGRRTQQGLDQAFNSIRSNSIGTGGYGGSRQGVAQGVATRGAMDSLQGNLASLFGGQYNQDASRDLSRYGMDQGFYTAQRGQDLMGTQIGGNLITQGVQGGWLPINQASNIFNTTAGNNVSNTNTSQQGGGWMGALGGGLGGAQLGRNAGWW